MQPVGLNGEPLSVRRSHFGEHVLKDKICCVMGLCCSLLLHHGCGSATFQIKCHVEYRPNNNHNLHL